MGFTRVSPAESEIQVGDLTLGFVREGSGPPLVLLHGGLSDHREWARQVDELSEAFDVVAWDTPGCGRSTLPPDGYRMSDYADRLADFIQALDLDRPHVLGLSWGSTLALELYRQRPDIPRSLVLTGAYAGWAGSLQPEIVAERLETALHDLEALSPRDFSRTWIPSLFSKHAAPEAVDEYLSVIGRLRPAGVAIMLRAMGEADLRDVLPNIEVPTLLLYGELDQRSPLAVAREIHQAIARSTLVVLPGVGHVANIEAPGAFNDAVRSFLNTV